MCTPVYYVNVCTTIDRYRCPANLPTEVPTQNPETRHLAKSSHLLPLRAVLYARSNLPTSIFAFPEMTDVEDRVSSREVWEIFSLFFFFR